MKKGSQLEQHIYIYPYIWPGEVAKLGNIDLYSCIWQGAVIAKLDNISIYPYIMAGEVSNLVNIPVYPFIWSG
jgi:hypothetical protein